mmetsp:Transcript_15191/g.22995  ORF Transcript_15191/g.22995 Transcript_15191/m.22995 type:complete len:308 (-) Transcript_15191:158-1081(-)|eukprot:CAMPEP_0167741912 /NCGR_PEP_ID=MMETSP0110_2-20121227/1124_1 /TAXON_ID=629695 /ORGANISM="Gymnochlora sp., Strain CCMP2014" /LENGTH=307 /DNA_ID=CAMNT_0007626025 /DNA_START=8 /DNA_END=934 /DNA_ORIENTATION=+
MANRDSKDFLKNLFAGTLCGSTVVMSFNPLDCLRIRWQVSKAKDMSMIAFSSKIIKEEGFIRGLAAPGLKANGFAASVSVGSRMGIYPFLRDGIIKKLEHKEKHPGVMFLAGLMPGMFGYWVSTPLWQIKTRLQAETGLISNGIYTTGACKGSKPVITGLFQGLSHVWRVEGFPQLYRGALALMLRGGGMSSGQFLGYDFTKTKMKSLGILRDGPILHVIASTVGAFLATTFSAPFDIVFTRMQAAPSMGIKYNGPLHCATSMIRQEGFMVMYRGWTVFFSRVAPVFTTLMPFYEQVRRMLGLGYMN